MPLYCSCTFWLCLGLIFHVFVLCVCLCIYDFTFCLSVLFSLFCTHVRLSCVFLNKLTYLHTIAVCFAVVPALYHLFLISLSQLFTWTLYFTLTLHIHLTTLISACWSATSFSFLIGQVSLPCNTLLCTQLLYSLPLLINDISQWVSNGANCRNLQQQQPFYGPLGGEVWPGLPGRAGTRRNTHPPTIVIIVQSLSASSIYHDP